MSLPFSPLNLLVVHPNFPGQFRHLAAHWARRPDVRLTLMGSASAPGLAGVPLLRTPPSTPVPNSHPYLRQMEIAVRNGQAAAKTYLALKAQGYRPDTVLAHPGWGDSLYLKEIFPEARLVHFCEWYYQARGADFGFDPEFSSQLDDHARITTWNALHSLNLNLCDEGVCPTEWQRAVHPEIFHGKLARIHEGVPTQRLSPDPGARCRMPNGQVLQAGDPVITYVARNLEPYRGFHHFMRALSLVQRRHPRCQAIIIGGDGVSYGKRPDDAVNWRSKLIAECRPDPLRTHFLGTQPYADYIKALQVSAVHVHLTYPFVLSWSVLEAMACGCLILGSDTAPVREVIRPGENGWLVDFFDDAAIAENILQALENPSAQQALRAKARQDVLDHYSLEQGLAGYARLLKLDPVSPAESLGLVVM